jgi:hypothetical protein
LHAQRSVSLFGFLEQLSNAVTTGEGLPTPRRTGALVFGIGLVLAGLNVATLFAAERFIPALAGLCALFLPAGLWLVITGEPAARPDGSPTPTWSRVGLGVALVTGGLVALVSFMLLMSPRR